MSYNFAQHSFYDKAYSALNVEVLETFNTYHSEILSHYGECIRISK